MLSSLEAGARLLHDEILAPLGAGGMGEVYRARDTKLGREVPRSSSRPFWRLAFRERSFSTW